MGRLDSHNRKYYRTVARVAVFPVRQLHRLSESVRHGGQCSEVENTETPRGSTQDGENHPETV